MKILFLNTNYKITLVPKIELSISDVISVNLTNEFTKIATELTDFTFEISGNYLIITLNTLPIDVKHKDKFEFSVIKGEKSVYNGKILVLNEGTNTQNYTNERARFQ